ncbi:zf-TFIIB domain-containing protein [Leptothoe spongobia]|uniref:Zf-TFIIB domain-containing protein n=1 Tax=Leptothoe spongobia TAU-MAC 1115 TaxID=1967444 RepID=A0A947GK62_9CYAN|nr:zf-TFIIB domain-containing protein [Leptothoe spongobia]MBT9317064.1 zf-TFIIB domain-containing protein [Leptothoe spongobia TAU-MAC 1115]
MPSTPEPRYNCPVCTGLPMQKLKITRQHQEVFLTLDCCNRCGGVWFDEGEVQKSQKIQSPKVRQHISQKPRRWMMHCHDCNTLMDRNLEHCDTCGWHNQIHCPVCTKALQRKHHKDLTLDICHSCQGVWFDQTELTSLWKQSLPEIKNSSKKQPASTLPKAEIAQISQGTHYTGVNLVSDTVGQIIVDGSLDILTQGGESDLVQAMAQTASHVIKGSAQAVADTPEMAGGIVESLGEVTSTALTSMGDLPELATVILEVTGEIAAGMTEVLADVIAGLFS